MAGAAKEVETNAQDALHADLVDRLLQLDDDSATVVLEKWINSKSKVFEAGARLTSSASRAEATTSTAAATTPAAAPEPQDVAVTVEVEDKGEPGEPQERRGSVGSTGSVRCRRKLERRQTSLKDNKTPIVQFGAPIFFASEEKQMAQIQVMRVGDLSEDSSVKYMTVDAQAKAGVKYVAQSGTLEFKKNEAKKSLEIEIIQDDAWDTTMEFNVKLLEEERINCVLGTYLKNCRVKIIDNDMFPTNKYDTLLKESRYDDISDAGLLIEYFKMNMTNKVVKKGVIKALIADQVKNLYSVIKLLANIMLVDKILIPGSSGATMKLLGVIAMLVVFFPFMHYLDYSKVFWKIGGTSRKTLQANLLRKFLNYDEASRMDVDMHELLMAMTRDVHAVVHKGFAKLIPLFAAFSRLALILIYQLALPGIMGDDYPTPEGWATRLYPTVLFPPLMMGFLALRNSKTVTTLRVMFEAEDEMMHDVAQTVSNYRLIADYKVRQYFVDRFDVTIGNFNKAFVGAGAVKVNNLKFAPWVTLIFSTLYILYGGLKVVGGGITLGQYLNTFAVINEIGKMWGQIFQILLEMQDTFPNLETLSRYMNLTTDVTHRMELAELDMEMGKEMVHRYQMESSEDIAVHRLPIVLRDISLSKSGNYHVPSINIELQQGKLYTIMGLQGTGKSTLLKVIGNALLPDVSEKGATCYIPTHLRMLHVSLEPMFFKGTLKENMKFAASKNDGTNERMAKIFRMIGLPEYIIEEVQRDPPEARIERFWVQHYSQTELVMLSLARAMITNPAVLCIHKPTICFQDDISETIFSVLNEFVQHRGLFQPSEQFHQREQRTCILTAARASAANWCEAVIHVAPKGCRLLNPQDLTKDDIAELCGKTPEHEDEEAAMNGGCQFNAISV